MADRKEQEMAVLFADITGSMRLFEGVGDEVARRIEKEWLAQICALLPRFDGKVIKTVGDEAMCLFASADQAVLAASAMHAEVLAKPPAGQAMTLHMGLHWGPVAMENGEVFGDTVNVAAYLAEVASPEQIVATEHVFKKLSDSLKFVVRPMFRTVLKGQTDEVILYQVLWRSDHADLTDNSFSDRTKQLIPSDSGGLLLAYRDMSVHLNHQKRRATLGRHSSCDLKILEGTASRMHARVELQAMSFYLIDESTNGTFVIIDDKPEVEVLRRDLRLEGSGKISLGCSFAKNPTEVITFSRDRRSMFRS